MYTVLASIKKKIQSLPCISFGEYYMNYVMNVQDSCIDKEISEFVRNSHGNIFAIDRKIEEEIARIADKG